MDTKIEAILAQNLIELRKSRNLKQSELSEKIGYSDKTISRWENGTSVPDIGTLVKLAEFYQVTVEDLIHENAVSTSESNKSTSQTNLLANRYAMMGLSVFTVWLLAALVYIGTIMFQEIYPWQAFLWAIPLSTAIVYRYTRKTLGLKWLNFAVLSATMIGAVCATFFTLIDYYNFWPLFLIIPPLEGMVVIFTLFNKKSKK